MARISVIVITFNEERNITDCLRSVSWTDQIMVVDSGSTDRTIELARACSATVLSVPWKGYGTARNVALNHAQGEWILWLDADERVPPELAAEIRKMIDVDDQNVDGYSVARRAYFLGRWIRHCGWYPSRVVRLFRKKNAEFTQNRVHERLVLEGRTAELHNDLLHYTDPDLHHYLVKFNSYTSLAAEDLKESGSTFSLFDAIVRPPFMFFKMYVIRLGFLDGIQGFILSVLSSFYVFAKYAKLWELDRNQSQ